MSATPPLHTRQLASPSSSMRVGSGAGSSAHSAHSTPRRNSVSGEFAGQTQETDDTKTNSPRTPSSVVGLRPVRVSSTPAPISALSMSSLPTPAVQSPKLVRLLTAAWPIPLTSPSTYGVGIGLILLILVGIDEVHLVVSEQHILAAVGSSVLDDLTHSLADDTAPRWILHLLRHSFAYRCLLCAVWIFTSFGYGLYRHGLYRKRGGARKRRSASSHPSADSSPVGSDTKKSVSFASEELAATGPELVSDIIPASRPSTKKRLRLFVFLALALASAGILFEGYLAFVVKQSTRTPTPGSVLATLEHTGLSLLDLVTWSSLYYALSRAVLVGLWGVSCAYGVYFLWWRKAVGPRKSKTKGIAHPGRAIEREAESDEDEDDDESEDDDEEEEEPTGEEQKTAVRAAGVSVIPAALVSAPSALAASSPSAPLTSPISPPSEDDTSDASDYSDSELDDSSSSEGARASFSIPTAAELLMFEKLDASLFFHPEQEQNQPRVRHLATASPLDQATEVVRRGTASTHTSPSHAKQLHSYQSSSASKPPAPGSHAVGPPPHPMRKGPPSPLASASKLSPPPVTLPLSSSSPLLHSTLYHLASTKFLDHLTHGDFVKLLPELQWQHLHAGDVIYRRGDQYTAESPATDHLHTDGMYIVVSGTVAALDPSDSSQVLSTFHQGDSFGELEFLFHHQPRALTTVARTAVQLLRIPTRLSRLWTPIVPVAEPPVRMAEDSSTPTAASAAASTTHHASSQFGAGSMLGPDQSSPRSDILLSFIRTTLARQWRSAEFILQRFLHLPLPTTPVIASSLPPPPPGTTPSRYFTSVFSSFFPPESDLFRALVEKTNQQLELSGGNTLFQEDDYRSDQLFIVLEGRVTLQSSTRGESDSSSLELGPGSVLNSISFLTDTTHSHTARAHSPLVRCAWLSRSDLLTPSPDILRLALVVCEVLAPTLAQWQAIGLQRSWIRAGTLLFREGQTCDAVYVISSGRCRIVTGKLRRVVKKKRTHAAAAAGTGGSSVPVSWASGSPSLHRSSSSSGSGSMADLMQSHPCGFDLSAFHAEEPYLPFQRSGGKQARIHPNASANRVRFELGRGELVGENSFLNGLDDAGRPGPTTETTHQSSALCTKDAELIRISRAAFEKLVRAFPRVALQFARIVSKRMSDMMHTNGNGSAAGQADAPRASVLSKIPRSPFLRSTMPSSTNTASCMSVCLQSASPLVDLHGFALQLSVSLASMGRTILLTPLHVDRILGEGTCAKLNLYYHRSLFTYWLSHIEAVYSFCLFVADPAINPWTAQCQRQADLTLIVAIADDNLEDDVDEDEIEDEAIAAQMVARRMRGKRVTQFEKIAAWNGWQKAITRQQKKRTREQQLQLQQQQVAHAAASSSTVGAHSNPHSSFSPTLHPAPATPGAPSAAQVTKFGKSAGSMAAGSSSSPSSACHPRLHFSLRDLVLLHTLTSSQQPHGTRFWCAARPSLHRYHHVAVGGQEHFDRLARYIAGKTVGVVLGGGGARGLSHLGVLSSFAEQAVPIDYIGGTSQGSFMASLYAGQAYHHTLALQQQMKARVHTLSQVMGSIADLLTDATFPVLSYFAGRKFGANIASILGEHVRIEDLWLPFFCVTTNLSCADMCVHDRGVLWKAVRASMTVLDYLPPLQISRKWPDLLIDGGYTNNLPVDVCQSLYKPCFVIGVDVENKSSEEKISRTSYFGTHLSGWWLLKRRLIDWACSGRLGSAIQLVRKACHLPPVEPPLNLPRFHELIGSLIYINHNRHLRQSLDNKQMDLYIRPELGTTALLDYHLEAQIIDCGYLAARQKLTEWRIRNSNQLPRSHAHQHHQQQRQQQAQAHEEGGPASGGSLAASPSSLLRTSSSVALGSTPPSSTLTRRKNGGVTASGRLATSFLPPASLTYTQDLRTATTSPAASPVMRATAQTEATLAKDVGGVSLNEFNLESIAAAAASLSVAAPGTVSAAGPLLWTPSGSLVLPTSIRSVFDGVHASESVSHAPPLQRPRSRSNSQDDSALTATQHTQFAADAIDQLPLRRLVSTPVFD